LTTFAQYIVLGLGIAIMILSASQSGSMKYELQSHTYQETYQTQCQSRAPFLNNVDSNNHNQSSPDVRSENKESGKMAHATTSCNSTNTFLADEKSLTLPPLSAITTIGDRYSMDTSHPFDDRISDPPQWIG